MAAAQDGIARGRRGAIIAVMRYCRPKLRRTLRRKGAGAAAETGCGRRVVATQMVGSINGTIVMRFYSPSGSVSGQADVNGTSSPLSFTAGCGPGAPEMYSHDEMAAGGTPLNTESLVRNEFR